MARGVDLIARMGVRGLRGTRTFFGFAERRLRQRQSRSQRRKIRSAAVGSGEACFDIGKLRLEPRGALPVIVHGGLQLIAARRQIGERAGQFGEGFFRSTRVPFPRRQGGR